MMIQSSKHRWTIDYCNQIEMGATQPEPTELSSDWSVPLDFGPLEDNLRHGSEEANKVPELETLNLDGSFV